MGKLLFMLLLLASPGWATPVEWDFVATGCTSNGGCVPGQLYPVVLARFTLPDLNSSGSATFVGHGPAAYVGDNFTLDYSWMPPLTRSFIMNNEPFGECEHLGEVCDFNLSWLEVGGQLDASLRVNTFSDSIFVTDVDATVASDNVYRSGAFAGCELLSCHIDGFWVDSPARVPEPSSLVMVLVGLIGVAGAYRLAM